MTELYNLQKAQLTEQYANQYGLRDFFNRITFGDLSGATPGGALEGERANFQALAHQARAGDQTALSKITGSGQSYLAASRAFNASGPGYQSDLASVQDVIGGLLAGNDNADVVGAIATMDQNVSGILTQVLDELAAQRADNLSLKSAAPAPAGQYVMAEVPTTPEGKRALLDQLEELMPVLEEHPGLSSDPDLIADLRSLIAELRAPVPPGGLDQIALEGRLWSLHARIRRLRSGPHSKPLLTVVEGASSEG